MLLKNVFVTNAYKIFLCIFFYLLSIIKIFVGLSRLVVVFPMWSVLVFRSAKRWWPPLVVLVGWSGSRPESQPVEIL